MARGRWKKIISITLIAVIALIVLGISFTIGWRPFIGAKKRALTDRKFEATPQRLARGKYLVDGVLGCFGCHSDPDWSKPGAPPTAGREGSGHVWADQKLPWLIAPNITSDKETGIGNWSDDTLARAIREGIGRDGRTLFPIMPYPNYRQMSDEDLASVIVYVRTAPPVRNQLATTRMPFPLNFLMQNMPEPVTAVVAAPDQSTAVARGAYLVRMGSCAACHTPSERGQPFPGMDFAGGFVLYEPNGKEVASANITPAPSGIGYYNEASFVQAMRTGKVGARALHASMPWYFYGKMTDDDLKLVFAYLQTLKPVKHQLDNTEPPTYCKLCKQKHGFGATN
jgi:mono/diheme cytochrome c family protein